MLPIILPKATYMSLHNPYNNSLECSNSNSILTISKVIKFVAKIIPMLHKIHMVDTREANKIFMEVATTRINHAVIHQIIINLVMGTILGSNRTKTNILGEGQMPEVDNNNLSNAMEDHHKTNVFLHIRIKEKL